MSNVEIKGSTTIVKHNMPDQNGYQLVYKFDTGYGCLLNNSNAAEEREEMAQLGIEHVRKNYNFDLFRQRWIDLIDDVTERLGSWETRQGYKPWEIREIV